MRMSTLVGVLFLLLMGVSALLLGGAAIASVIADNTGIAFEDLRTFVFGFTALALMASAWGYLRWREDQSEQEKAKHDLHSAAEARLSYGLSDDGELVPLDTGKRKHTQKHVD